MWKEIDIHQIDRGNEGIMGNHAHHGASYRSGVQIEPKCELWILVSLGFDK